MRPGGESAVGYGVLNARYLLIRFVSPAHLVPPTPFQYVVPLPFNCMSPFAAWPTILSPSIHVLEGPVKQQKKRTSKRNSSAKANKPTSIILSTKLDSTYFTYLSIYTYICKRTLTGFPSEILSRIQYSREWYI